MEENAVVTCFLRHGTEILLVRRGEAVGSCRGRWGVVSGYAEGDPGAAARWEIDEEVGLLNAVDLVRSAEWLEAAGLDPAAELAVEVDCDAAATLTLRGGGEAHDLNVEAGHATHVVGPLVDTETRD